MPLPSSRPDPPHTVPLSLRSQSNSDPSLSPAWEQVSRDRAGEVTSVSSTGTALSPKNLGIFFFQSRKLGRGVHPNANSLGIIMKAMSHAILLPREVTVSRMGIFLVVPSWRVKYLTPPTQKRGEAQRWLSLSQSQFSTIPGDASSWACSTDEETEGHRKSVACSPHRGTKPNPSSLNDGAKLVILFLLQMTDGPRKQ